MLELRNITKRFGAVLANDGVSFTVKPGTIHAIVGENGAGKSTAMRIAYGFYTADSGEILIDGQLRVELLKALYRQAKLWILDEPTAVLTPQEVEEFFVILRRMREQGKTIVIITHKLSEVLAISDNVTVMRDGRVVGDLKTSETNAAELARLMVGREVLLRVEKPDAKASAAVLAVKGLSITGRDGGKRLDNISFEVRAGEIVGIAGVEGNGQTELIEALAGLIPGSHMSGEITFQGRDITRLDARKRKELGIAHVPEDRHRRGLLLDFSLAENTILGVHYRKPAVSSNGVLLDERGIQRRAEQVIRDFDVRPPNPMLPARSLSGGNQQKLIIGREFELPPKLLLVSQPTRGVDIGAIEFIHRKIVTLRDAGCAVLLVSAELEEVTSLSDRLLVLHNGKVAGEVDPKKTSNEEIGLMMTGGTAAYWVLCSWAAAGCS